MLEIIFSYSTPLETTQLSLNFQFEPGSIKNVQLYILCPSIMEHPLDILFIRYNSATYNLYNIILIIFLKWPAGR